MLINIYSKKYIYTSVSVFIVGLLGLIISGPLNFSSLTTNILATVSVISFCLIITPLTRKKYDALNKIEHTITSPDANPQQKKILLYSIIIGFIGLMALMIVRSYFHF